MPTNKITNFFEAFTLGRVTGFALLGLVIAMIISYILSSIFGTQMLKLDEAFIFLVVGIALIVIFNIFFRGLTKENLIGMLILGIIIIVLFIYLPKLLPTFFNKITLNAIINLQSILGLP